MHGMLKTEDLYNNLVENLGTINVKKFNKLQDGTYRSIIVQGEGRMLMITPTEEKFILSSSPNLNNVVIDTELNMYTNLEVDRRTGISYIVSEYIKNGRFIKIEDNVMKIA